jgi:hypothetical protein
MVQRTAGGRWLTADWPNVEHPSMGRLPPESDTVCWLFSASSKQL